jgi:hypothetical protein
MKMRITTAAPATESDLKLELATSMAGQEIEREISTA